VKVDPRVPAPEGTEEWRDSRSSAKIIRESHREYGCGSSLPRRQ
jgi:hypothetical protein